MQDLTPTPESRKWSRRRWAGLIVLGTLWGAAIWGATAKPTVAFVRFAEIEGTPHAVFLLQNYPFRAFTYYTTSLSSSGSEPLVSWHVFADGHWSEPSQLISGMTRDLHEGEEVEFRVALTRGDVHPNEAAFRIGVTFSTPGVASRFPPSVGRRLPASWHAPLDWTVWSEAVKP